MSTEMVGELDLRQLDLVIELLSVDLSLVLEDILLIEHIDMHVRDGNNVICFYVFTFIFTNNFFRWNYST
jgi:hypothetical protein